MRATSVIYRRELGAYLRSPFSWVIGALVLLVDGITKVAEPYEQGGGLSFTLSTTRDARADVSRAVVDAKLDLLKLDYGRSELENTFIRLVGGTDASN